MAENKKSFVAYSDWNGMFKALPNEVAGELIKHIFSYVNDENPKTDNYVINALFEQIKATLKRDLQKWESQRDQRSEAGKRSAKKRAKQKEGNPTSVKSRSTKSNEPTRKATVSDSVSVNVSANVNDIDDDVLYPVTTLFSLYFANPKLVKAVLDNNNFTSEEALKKRVEQFNRHLSETGQFAKTWKDYTSHFLNWHKKALNGASVRKSPTDITL